MHIFPRQFPRKLTCIAVLLGLAAGATSVHADTNTPQFIEDTGASQRIDFSGKLRMLSQRIVAAGCNYAADIDPNISGPALGAAKEEFQMIVDALEFGNNDLGIIGPEERRRTLVGLSKLRELWGPAAASGATILADQGSPETVATFADQSAPLLDMAKLMVSQISAQYSDPTALLQADALVIDIAGRQRMLTQRMSKNVCLISSGLNVETALAELDATAQMFDTSLNALRYGMPEAGIKLPPNEEITAGLDVVISDWAILKPIVDRVLAGHSLDAEQRSIMFNGANTMTGNMNTVVGLYSVASKLGL
ncbi:type IV pili methyl-accepting chemotaxis transducer N-terminal domain-containing protein [Yoonia sp. BS5-3]|uniref:Type IV pili methyl-accepting chemotaxis transducer N-terminal domain-containing protein n=1 Tax=Yoonia phaeophyticola TaxID=3137369 RepID=A0ABZ2V7C2_9RHOB